MQGVRRGLATGGDEDHLFGCHQDRPIESAVVRVSGQRGGCGEGRIDPTEVEPPPSSHRNCHRSPPQGVGSTQVSAKCLRPEQGHDIEIAERPQRAPGVFDETFCRKATRPIEVISTLGPGGRTVYAGSCEKCGGDHHDFVGVVEGSDDSESDVKCSAVDAAPDPRPSGMETVSARQSHRANPPIQVGELGESGA